MRRKAGGRADILPALRDFYIVGQAATLNDYRTLTNDPLDHFSAVDDLDRPVAGGHQLFVGDDP
jgi:hypothetical protein